MNSLEEKKVEEFNIPDKVNSLQELKEIFLKIHSSNTNINNNHLDNLLGINTDGEFVYQSPTTLNLIDLILLKSKYHKMLTDTFGDEQFDYEGIPYAIFRQFLKSVNPQKNNIIYDLGSGRGRAVFYGALTTPATFKGIEIVPSRVEDCQTIKDQFKIENSEFIMGNVTERNFADGDHFFMFNPFNESTLETVAKRLQDISKQKEISIGTYGPINNYLISQNWLKRDQIYDGKNMFTLGIFRNK